MSHEETPSEETTTRINALTAKLKKLPWKMIAIGTAATAATAAVVILSRKLDEPAYEIDIDEVTPEGEIHTHITPITD